MPKPSSVIALVEDERHEMLVRRYLRRSGIEGRQVRFERSPSGQGSAEQWVRSNFAREVSAYRNRQARAATALIVMIDADAHTVQGRLTQLSEGLEEGGIQAVGSAEHIARLVPRRNVETWISSLNGRSVDEVTDYKPTRNDWNDFIPQAANVLFDWARPAAVLPAHCVDSLRSGLSEIHRLGF
jgi:hypothetical protein